MNLEAFISCLFSSYFQYLACLYLKPCENVNNSIFNIDMNKVNLSCQNFFFNKVIVHLNVLCPNMIDQVVSK
jgi:hypothetical protein